MITVLMPAYNNSKYIDTAVRSILAQTFGDFEFLIIDDCSTDDTVTRIKSFNDPRIRLIINDKNEGLGPTLNKGLREARHDIIARMDGDDISLPERLEKQYGFLTKHDDTDVLSSHYAMFEDGRILFNIRTNETHEGIKKRLALHSEIIHPGVMYRKSLILESGGYGGSYIEDYELWLRIKDTVRFHNIPETLILKRYHSESISLDIERKNSVVYSYTAKYFDDPVKEFGISRSDANFIRGWREYFYGNKKDARKYFLKSPLKLLLSPRTAAGFFSTYLGSRAFSGFREKRLRFRLGYFLKYFSPLNRELRKALKRYS